MIKKNLLKNNFLNSDSPKKFENFEIFDRLFLNFFATIFLLGKLNARIIKF
jgi:hypothetical protein